VTGRLVAVSSLVVLVAGLALGQGACATDSGSGKGGDEDRAAVRAAVRSIDLAVTRVEDRAALASGEPGLRALEVRRLLDKWHNTHTAVFAVDPRAARGRVQSVLDWLAELSPKLVTLNRAGRPAAIDDAGVARVLTPDAGTRAIANRERLTIGRELGVLEDRLGGRPATMVIVGDRDVPGASADDVLVRLQARLQMLYPDAAQHVMQLRLGLPR
jgi:hypothetical protein